MYGDSRKRDRRGRLRWRHAASRRPGGAGGRGAFPAMDVKTITIAPKPIPQTSEFVATVQSLRSTNIQPQVEGYVRQIMVKAGDRVRAGQPLVQIDPEKQQATVSAIAIAARLARGRPRVRAAAARPHEEAVRRRRRQPRGARAGRDRGEDRGGAARGGRLADSREPGGAAGTTV